jgi:hypothetical protein
MFARFEAAGEPDKKKHLARQICTDDRAHYPRRGNLLSRQHRFGGFEVIIIGRREPAPVIWYRRS